MENSDFRTNVIERSHSIPVVVDFWAPWCGPCRVLGPVIEALATEQAGRWALVKLNTEEDYETAEQYNIRSIPNVKMFYKGEVIAEFAGALPKTAIENWLDDHLPDDRKGQLEEILQKVGKEKDAGALDDLRAFVSENPDLPEARVTLARQLVFSEPETALQMVEDVQLGDPLFDAAEDTRTLAEFMEFIEETPPAGPLLLQAQNALRKGDEEQAIQKIIEAATVDKTLSNELPRRAAIALFRRWGTQHPLTKNYRWRFDMALY